MTPAKLQSDEHWTSEFWQSERGGLHVRTKGETESATPVLFLHSLGPGHSQQQWLSAADLIAADHPVALIDLLGWGESDRPDIDYGLAASLETLQAFTEQELASGFHLVASGESAPIALSLAEKLPHSVLSVALSGPAGLKLDAEQQSGTDWAVDKLLGAPIFRTSAVNAYTRRSAIENNLLRHQLAAPTADQASEHYRLAHLPGSARPISAFLRGRYERSLESVSSSSNLKLWIGWGRKAMGEPVEDADVWLRHFDQAELVVFEQAASWPHVDVPEQFAQELLRFLA